MSELFGDLTYGTKVVNPKLRPVEAIAAMYETQNKKYEYAVDNYNKAETLLNQIPVDPEDEHIVMKAQKVLDDELANIAEKGDYENYAFNSKQLTHDLANKYGLSAVQNKFNQKSAYAEEIKAKIDSKQISAEEGKRYLRDAARNTKPLAYDEELQRWEGSYKGATIGTQEQQAKKVADFLSGIKADTLIGENGETYKRNKTGDGYINTVTGEGVSQAKAIKAAEAYLRNDPQFNSEAQQDLYFDIGDMTYNEETGEYDAMTFQDLTSSLPPSFIKEGARMLGLEEGEDLEAAMEEKDISPEQLYRVIKTEEKLQRSIEAGVTKESYTQYKNEFAKDWLMANSLTNKKQEELAIRNDFGTISTISVKTTTTADDLVNTTKMYSNASSQLNILDKQLKTLTSSNANPNEIRKTEEAIKEQKRIVESTIDKQSRDLAKIPNVKDQINRIINKEMPAAIVNGVENKSFEHTNISYAPMEKLVFKAMSGQDVLEEAKQYVSGEFDEEQAREDYKKYNESKQYTRKKVTEDLYVQRKRDLFDKSLENEAKGLANEIKNIADSAIEETKKNPINHTQSWGSYSMPEMSAGERQNNPVAQLEYTASNMPKDNPKFYDQATDVNSGLDLATSLGEQYGFDQDDIADGDAVIDWENAKVDTIIDLLRDKDGNYRPALSVTVDIETDEFVGKNKITTTVPVFIDEPSYNEKSKEATEKYKNELARKRDAGTISGSETIMYNRLVTNMFEGSKYGKTFPTTQLYNANNGDIIEVPLNDGGVTATVEVSTKGELNSNSNGMSYYVKSKDGLYYATDTKGNQTKVTKEQLGKDANGHYEYTPMGAETPYDLKVLMGQLLYGEDGAKPKAPQGGSVAVSHNNPGNIKMGAFAQKYNATKGRESTEDDGSHFAVFNTVEEGLQAQRDLLTSGTYANLTVDAAMKKWSGQGYGAEIFPAISNKRMSELTTFELAELQRRQIKREDAQMYTNIYGG